MPFDPNFSVSQNYGSIADFTIVDTSTGTDASITNRLIYLVKEDGTYLRPSGYTTDYITWLISGNQLVITDVLNKDYALDIRVDYYAGTTIIYTKSILTLFVAYSELFLRQLTQAQAANPKLLGSSNFWYNKLKLRTLLDDATQAIVLINDQTIATYCLDKAKYLTDNLTLFY